MTQKNRTSEGKNRTWGRGGQKSSKIVGHHLCKFPKTPVVPLILLMNLHFSEHFCSNTENRRLGHNPLQNATNIIFITPLHRNVV